MVLANAWSLESAKLSQRHFIRIHDKSVMAPFPAGEPSPDHLVGSDQMVFHPLSSGMDSDHIGRPLSTKWPSNCRTTIAFSSITGFRLPISPALRVIHSRWKEAGAIMSLAYD